MYKYIGIRGHRGAGKNTISRLIGAMIDTYNNKQEFDEVTFEQKTLEYYNCVCEQLIQGETEISSTLVHYETFADTPITMVHLIFGIPMDYCYNDEKKDTVVINLKTFEYEIEQENAHPLTSARSYFEMRNAEIDCEPAPKKMADDVYMTLRELISYYGNYVMKYFFGANTWIKSLQTTQQDMDMFYTEGELMYKIYTDVKFTSEVDYIKERDGIIINVIRKNKDKGNYETSTNLMYDTRVDYTIEYEDILDKSTFEQIINIVKQIYK